MKFMKACKDGGPQSTVIGLFIVEIKKLFSIAFLRFDNGSREEYHSHAFTSLSWVLKGELTETIFGGGGVNVYKRSWKPIVTYRDTFHRVSSKGISFVFTLRGPWTDIWQEWNPKTDKIIQLTHGRKKL